ncbi:putative class I holin [Salmonella phage S4lw]|nr:putative class I holin [Salmonella phage S4lw]
MPNRNISDNGLTADKLREVLHYDPDTGVFTWKATRVHNAGAGSEAGANHCAGYRSIAFGGKRYLAHRLAWLYMTGEWPNSLIDHINGDGRDNRFCNLREADKSENGCNKGPRKDSKSGIKNVMWQKQQGGWYVQLKIHKIKYFYGYFADLELAALVAEEAREKIHGVFANHKLREGAI